MQLPGSEESLMVQTQAASRKQRIERAIAAALDRRWDLAAEANRALLEDYPDDVESANRLGKALTELDDFAAAAEAYERALAIDGTNAIARKNLARLRELAPVAPRGKTKKGGRAEAGAGAQRRSAGQPAPQIRAHSLIEESGRSADFALLKPDAEALREVTAGDPARLEPAANGVVVQSDDGVTLGTIEPRAALRLKRMIEGGNRYAAVIRRVADGEATVYIREAYTHPSLVGQPSFVPSVAARRRRAPRAYTKPSVVRYDRDAEGDDFDEDREEGWTPRRGAALEADEDEAMERRGLSATVDEEEEEEEVEFDDDVEVGEYEGEED